MGPLTRISDICDGHAVGLEVVDNPVSTVTVDSENGRSSQKRLSLVDLIISELYYVID